MMSEVRLPDSATVRQFLKLLDPNEVFNFVAFDDKGMNRTLSQSFFGFFDDCKADLVALNDEGAGIFITINEANGKGRKAEHIVRVRAVFVDLDGSDIVPVESWVLQPHIIVESSPGRWHAYWLVSDLPIERFRDVQRALADRFDGDRSVNDLSRVMRLPGFHHCKAEPTPVVIKTICESLPPYSGAQVLDALSLDHARPAKRAAEFGVIRKGERNSTLTRVAGQLRRTGMREAEICDSLMKVNHDHCVEPLDEPEVQVIAASVSRYPVSTEPSEFSVSDTGNAKRFVDQHGDDLKYVPERGKWIFWDGLRWSEDGHGRVVERAKETAKSLFVVAAESRSDVARAALAKHAAQSLNQGRLSAMVRLATTDSRVVVSVSDLDADDFIMGVQNGVVDLRDGSFRDVQRGDLLTLRSDVFFDPAAKCPIFSRFVERVTGGDAGLQTYLQRFVGYAMTGSTAEQCFAFLYGHGANGKSTFLDVITRLCGDYATQTQPETLMARRGGGASSDLARLAGRRLVISNEVREGAQLEENLIKQLVGGDVVTARFLYQEHFEFRPKFKLMIAGNHMPIIKGDDHGIWRRVHLVPFVHTIPEKERDKALGEKLAGELSGILNWAIQGCLDWQRDGLAVPSVIAKATQKYRDEMDILGNWIEQECVVDPGSRVSSKLLYDNYRKWCEFGSIKPMSNMVFVRKLEMRGFRREHTRSGNVISGVTLRMSLSALAA